MSRRTWQCKMVEQRLFSEADAGLWLMWSTSQKGINVDEEVDLYQCEKGFRYGNSQKEVTDLCVMLPTYVGGRKRKVLCYVIRGRAPILIGRPLLKKFGLVVDFEQDKVLFTGGDWQPATMGERGEYMIHLAADIEKLRDSAVEPEILMPDDLRGL